jgi:hypothetical protein
VNGPESNDEHDQIESVAQELRESVSGEFRRIAEEDEHAAYKARLRRRTLGHVASELLARGDLVACVSGDASFAGEVVHAGTDFATLHTAAGEYVEVNLAAAVAIRVDQRSTAGGRSRDPYGPETFLARLRELELEETGVEVLMPGGRQRIRGRIEAAATDHILVVDDAGGEWFVPRAAITFVVHA